MPKMTSKSRRDIVDKCIQDIEGALAQISFCLENTESRKEADELFKMLRELEPIVNVDDIWDYWVDWDKVKWKRKEE